jgi:hypothetical protein
MQSHPSFIPPLISPARSSGRPGDTLIHQPSGFLNLLLERISWNELDGLDQRKNAAGRRPRQVTRGQLLAAVLFHGAVSLMGTMGEHLFELLKIRMAESTLSERRQALPLEVFKELLGRILRPIQHPDESANYKGMRLVAIDGVSFSVPNTAQLEGKLPRGGNHRSEAAFAKLQCGVLLELVTHNPLAARLGSRGQSEWELGMELIESLPADCLLLGDRLYGCGAFLFRAWKKLSVCNGNFLVRAKEGLQVLVIEELKDGSRIVEIHTAEMEGPLRVREIRATIQREGSKGVSIRLWTSLMDPTQFPAEELVQLYATRWEEELYFRELKATMGVKGLLRAHTVETAAQEVAGMIIGSSLLAHQRSKLEPAAESTLRVSLRKTRQLLEPLWLTLLLGDDFLSAEQKQKLCDRFYEMAARMTMAKKRVRSCPRVKRQPMSRWPRKKEQKSTTAPLVIRITRNDS